jgi:hypothetical protein
MSTVITIACFNAILLYITRTEDQLLYVPAKSLVEALNNPVTNKIYDCLLCSSFWISMLSVSIMWIVTLADSVLLLAPLMTIITIYAYKILE